MRNLLIVVVLIAAVAAGGYWYWTTTPQYAVQQASAAIKNHDVAAFHDWVDVQSLSSSAVDDLVSEPVRKVGGAGLLERIVGFGVVSLLKPTVTQSMSKQIDDLVAKNGPDDPPPPETQEKGILGQLVALVKPPSLTQTLREYGFNRKNYRGVGEVETSDQMSHVPLRFYSPKAGREVEVRLELRRGAGRWQVTRISNLQEIVRNVVAG